MTLAVSANWGSVGVLAWPPLEASRRKIHHAAPAPPTTIRPTSARAPQPTAISSPALDFFGVSPSGSTGRGLAGGVAWTRSAAGASAASAAASTTAVSPGTATTEPQEGHLTFLPARASLSFSFLLHWPQVTNMRKLRDKGGEAGEQKGSTHYNGAAGDSERKPPSGGCAISRFTSSVA